MNVYENELSMKKCPALAAPSEQRSHIEFAPLVALRSWYVSSRRMRQFRGCGQDCCYGRTGVGRRARVKAELQVPVLLLMLRARNTRPRARRDRHRISPSGRWSDDWFAGDPERLMWASNALANSHVALRFCRNSWYRSENSLTWRIKFSRVCTASSHEFSSIYEKNKNNFTWWN